MSKARAKREVSLEEFAAWMAFFKIEREIREDMHGDK
jgi:hypothetical protein